jgi:hypothetical protein
MNIEHPRFACWLPRNTFPRDLDGRAVGKEWTFPVSIEKQLAKVSFLSVYVINHLFVSQRRHPLLTSQY